MLKPAQTGTIRRGRGPRGRSSAATPSSWPRWPASTRRARALPLPPARRRWRRRWRPRWRACASTPGSSRAHTTTSRSGTTWCWWRRPAGRWCPSRTASTWPGLASLLGLPVVVAARPGLGHPEPHAADARGAPPPRPDRARRRHQRLPGRARPGRPHQPAGAGAPDAGAAAGGHRPRPRDRRRGAAARAASPRSARPASTRCWAAPSRPRASAARARRASPPWPPTPTRGAPSVDPTDAAHVMQTPEEYADFLSGMSFDKRVEMLNSFRCAELQGAEELRVLSETVDDPDLANKFARHAADEEKHGAYFGEIMRRLGAEPFDPPDEPDHITIGGRLIVNTLNDIEEILPRRGETVGLDRVIPILTLFQAVESRALVSFEAPPAGVRAGRPGRRRAHRRDHRRREPPRPLRARRCSTAGPRRGGPTRCARRRRRPTPARRRRATGRPSGSRPSACARRGSCRRADRPSAGSGCSPRWSRPGGAGVSGEALAAELGCSRAAVHRHVEALRREGLGVRRRPGRLPPRRGRRPGRARCWSPRAWRRRWRARSSGWPRPARPTTRRSSGRAPGPPRASSSAPTARRAGRGRRGRAVARGAPATRCWRRRCCAPACAPVDAGLLPIVVAVGVRRGPRAGRPHRLAQRHPDRGPQGGRHPLRDVGRPGAGRLGGRRDRRQRPLGAGARRRALDPRRAVRPRPARRAAPTCWSAAPARARPSLRRSGSAATRRAVLGAFAERDALAGPAGRREPRRRGARGRLRRDRPPRAPAREDGRRRAAAGGRRGGAGRPGGPPGRLERDGNLPPALVGSDISSTDGLLGERGAGRARPGAPVLRRGGAAGHQRLLGAGRVPVPADRRSSRPSGCAAGRSQGHGCPGLSPLAAGLVSMELARGDGSVSTFHGVHSGLAMNGDRAAGLRGAEASAGCRRWRGSRPIGAFALTEPEHGSDAVSLETQVRRLGDGYVLDGAKRWIGNATFADAHDRLGARRRRATSARTSSRRAPPASRRG